MRRSYLFVVMSFVFAAFLTGCGVQGETGASAGSSSASTVLSELPESSVVSESSVSSSVPETTAESREYETVTMGRYQGSEIEWIVLDKNDEGMLLLSKYVIDAMPYNDKFVPVKWEDCTMRKWLNSVFLNEAFTEEERDIIMTVTLVNNDNPVNGQDGGPDTEDKVFLLSIDEAYKYFSTNDSRKAQMTEYTRSKEPVTDGDDCCYWWLRSPGQMHNNATYVYLMGMVNEKGFEVHYKNYGLRPAMWVRYK